MLKSSIRNAIKARDSWEKEFSNPTPTVLSQAPLLFDIMATSGKDKIGKQSKEDLERIAQISMTVRDAVRSALPAPAEQFFTMMVPGKVLNLDVSISSPTSSR